MNTEKMIKITFKTLGMIALAFVLCGNIVNGQTRAKSKVEIINDANFKKIISKGFVIVTFTSGYQMKPLDSKLFDGVKGYEGCIVIEVKQENAKKVTKKLRIRNYPSIALFHNGKKKEVWKADMDGKVDISNKGIKKSISDALAGDVF